MKSEIERDKEENSTEQRKTVHRTHKLQYSYRDVGEYYEIWLKR